MEVHQLQILRELGDLGSVTAVADSLYVTPSAVSQQLAQLQRGIDVPLTRKEGRNLVLTDAGRVLATAGASVISAMAQARAAIGSYQHDSAGQVSISGFHSVGQALFAPLLARMSGDGDPRPLFFDEDVAQQDFPALTARYDLVLAHRMDHSPPWPADRVAVLPLAHEPLDIALPADHPLCARETLTPHDLADCAWAVSRDGYSPADIVASVAAVNGQPPRIAHRINDYTTVAALVATGDLFGVLPRYTAGALLGPGVVLRPLTGVGHRRRIDVLARPETLRRTSVQRVAAELANTMAELVARGGG